MARYYDRLGALISVEDYQNLVNDFEYKKVAKDTLPNGYIVSTVWLGMDHNFCGGEPLIFETMVFPSENEFNDLACRRYCSEDDALKGHKEVASIWEGL